jgi:tetratricopeptide (TPR) repeat protein
MKNCPPDSLAYIRTQAEVDVRRGRSEDVITMFSQLVKSPGEEDIKKQRLRFVAQLAEQLGAQDPKMFAVADSAFRQFVAKDPNANVEYLDFQIRRFDATKTRDMLTICSKMMDANQHSAALSRAVTLLRAGGDRIPQREKVVQLIRSWFDKAIKANPDDLMLTIHRAELEGNLGDTDTQANMLREFVEKNKTQTILRAIALNNLSYIESLRGNGDQAKVLIDEAIAIFGPQTQLRDTVGMALLAQGKAAEAIEEFQYVIDHGDSSALILFHLFWALWENGQVDQAVDAMTKAKLKGLSDRDFTTGLEIEKFQELKIAMAKQGYNFENLGSTADRQESDRAR